MKRVRVLGYCLLLAAGSTWASEGEWSSSGPLGGDVFELIVDPMTSGVVYATTQGGVYRSQDSGMTFEPAQRGIVASTVYPLPLMLDAEASTKLYTSDSSGRMYRTSDGANTWEIFRGDFADDLIPGRMFDIPGSICEFVMASGTQRFANEPMLWKTTDCGNHFRNIGVGLPPDVFATFVAFNPAAPNEVLVGMNGSGSLHASILRSTDGGETFSSVLDLSSIRGYTPSVNDIRFGPSATVWASVDYQLFHSLDNGQTWIEVLPTGPGSAVAAATVFPAPTQANKVYVGRGDGVYVVSYSATPSPTYTITGFSQGLTPNQSYLGGGNPLPASVNRISATVDFPTSGVLLASTDGAGVFRRAPVDGMLNPPWSSSSELNPAGARMTGVQIHPSPAFATGVGIDRQGSFLLAAQNNFSAASQALYLSVDGGNDWNAHNNGLRAANLNALIYDPTSFAVPGNTIWYAAGDSGVAESTYRNAGLYRSDDNATTWANIEGNLPDQPGNDYVDLGDVHALALDRRSCAAPPTSGPCLTGPLNTLYAAADGIYSQPIPGQYAFSHQVLRSDDRGTTWIDLSGNPGFPVSFADAEITQKIVPIAIATSPTDGNLVFVGTRADYLDNAPGSGNSPADLHSGLFRSADRGATWTHITAGLEAKDSRTNTYLDVTAIAVHPNGTTVWLAATDLASSGKSTVYRSTDAGLNFTRLDNGINGSVYLRGLAIDPNNPNVLYAAGSGFEANPGAVFRSANGGQDWYSISVGLPAESAYGISVDPHNSAILHVGTDNGVWSITQQVDTDNDGVPDAIEDAGPNNGDSNFDNVPDSLQGDVGSIGVALRGGPTATYTTIDVLNGSGPGTLPCSQSVDVQANEATEFGLDAEESTDADFYKPNNAVTFELQNCRQASVNVTFHGANFNQYGWQFRYFGPSTPGDFDTIAWHGLPLSRARRLGSATWQLNLSNTELGNYRPAADDAIRFVGVPACAPDDRVFVTNFESGETLPASCYPAR